MTIDHFGIWISIYIEEAVGTTGLEAAIRNHIALLLIFSIITGAGTASRGALIGYWDFEDRITDQSGNGNNASAVGNPAYVTGTPAPLTSSTKAISFDGDDHLDITQNSGLPLNPTAAFTISMWVNGANNQTDRRIFSEGSTTDSNPLFNLGTQNNTGPKLDFYYRNDGGQAGANHIHSTGDVFDSTWHHIAWVDDNGTVTLYIDGVADATNFSYTRSTLTTNTTTFSAIRRAAVSHWFTGSMDDISVWDEALDSSQVSSLFGGTSPLLIPEPATLTLGAVGLSGLLGFRRRKRTNRSGDR